jgi:uncharacterized protein (DUF305 family)
MLKASPNAGPLVLLLAATTVLFAALALWFFLSGQTPGDGSVEAGFARDMSVHHAQAVEMAEIARDKTESAEIRTLATDIALTQQGQIGHMQGWLSVWRLPPTGPEPPMAWMGHPTEGRMPGMASPEEIRRLQEASPGEADRLFLQLMIPHHQAAIPMAEAALERTDNPQVTDLAEGIIAAQRGEIRVMNDLLEERGAEAPTGSHGGHEH